MVKIDIMCGEFMKKLELTQKVKFKNQGNGLYRVTTQNGDIIVNEIGKFIIENIPICDFYQICFFVKNQFNLEEKESQQKTKQFLCEMKKNKLIIFQENDLKD